MLPTAIPPKQHKNRRPLTEHPGKTCEGFREERVHSKAAEKSKHFTTNWIFYLLLWLYSLLLKWSFSQVFILFLPFRKLKNPWAKSVLNLCKPEFPKQMKERRVGRSWGGEKEKEGGREGGGRVRVRRKEEKEKREVREGGRKEEKRKERKSEDTFYTLSWPVYIICYWQSVQKQLWEKWRNLRCLGRQDCSQRIFTAYMEASQTSALARHLEIIPRWIPSCQY